MIPRIACAILAAALIVFAVLYYGADRRADACVELEKTIMVERSRADSLQIQADTEAFIRATLQAEYDNLSAILDTIQRAPRHADRPRPRNARELRESILRATRQ